MKERLIAGLDLGSSHVRLAVGQVTQGPDKRGVLNLIGAIEVPSQGISKGAVNSLEDAVSSISACLEQAERQIGLPVGEAYVGLSGTYVQVQASRGVVGVSRGEGDIRPEDISRVLESARAGINPVNYEILHVLPRNFSVDGQSGIKDPLGMQGIRLEVDAHMVQGLATPVRNLAKAVLRTGLDVTELVFSPLATAEAVTSPRQQELGVVVVNIGASTTSLTVFEEGELIHAAVIPIGADHITNDIAIGLRTSLDVAERFKQAYACAIAGLVRRTDALDLRDLGAEQSEIVSPRFVSEIVQARAEEIFEKVEEELKKIERSGLLPAGAVLTGGGVKLSGIVEVAKQVLRLPACVASAGRVASPLLEAVQDPAFSTAIGLVQWGFANENDPGAKYSSGAAKQGGGWLSKIGSPIKKIFKSFIP